MRYLEVLPRNPLPRAYWICTSDPIADVPAREAALRETGANPWRALAALTGDARLETR